MHNIIHNIIYTDKEFGQEIYKMLKISPMKFITKGRKGALFFLIICHNIAILQM